MAWVQRTLNARNWKAWILCNWIALLPSAVGLGAEGDPLAIRSWSQGAISLENHWGLKLGLLPPGVDESVVPAGHQSIRTDQPCDSVLFREANQPAAQWKPTSPALQAIPHAIQVNSITATEVASQSLQIRADGARVVHLRLDNLPPTDEPLLDAEGPVDLIILTVESDRALDASAASWLKQLKPRRLLINPLGETPNVPAAFLETLETDAIRQVTHNTLALSASDEPWSGTQVLTLADEPWQMPAELEAEFQKMEEACEAAQKVFSKLSVRQMNFQPSNGTHTPRWNTEHMMGRQLLFFSQIYHELDADIPVMDLNPAQMPPDYRFAHADWTGQEEARQMQRVSAFTRRFAYLLDGQDLDRRAPGSRWPTLRALLRQMQNHYGEHTANTIKKFDLVDWPKE